jgi:hypothetical protein
MGHFPFGIHQLLPKPSTYLTVLRDPINRVVSLYYHALKYSNNPLHERLVAERIGLKEFVSDIACKEAHNDQTRRLSGLNPDFGRCSGEMLEIAKENLRVHFLRGRHHGAIRRDADPLQKDPRLAARHPLLA